MFGKFFNGEKKPGKPVPQVEKASNPAAAEIEKLAVSKGNESHNMRNIVRIAKANNITPEMLSGSFQENAYTMFKKTLDNIHVYDAPLIIEDFAAFMGPSFVQDTEVRKAVVEKMAKVSKGSALSQLKAWHTDLADMNSLIATFNLQPEEMASLMTPELKEALQQVPWTEKEISAAHDEWAAEMLRQGKEPGYEVDFDVSKEMPKRRPKDPMNEALKDFE